MTEFHIIPIDLEELMLKLARDAFGNTDDEGRRITAGAAVAKMKILVDFASEAVEKQGWLEFSMATYELWQVAHRWAVTSLGAVGEPEEEVVDARGEEFMNQLEVAMKLIGCDDVTVVNRLAERPRKEKQPDGGEDHHT